MLQPDQQHPLPPLQSLTKGFCLALGLSLHLNWIFVFPEWKDMLSLWAKLCSHAQACKASMQEVCNVLARLWDLGLSAGSLGGFIQTSGPFQL